MVNAQVIQQLENNMDIQWYESRQVKIGTKVKVYFNLHKHLFSIVAMEGEYKGKVVGHANAVFIAHPQFVVNKSGRERVLRERRKNVHAFVVGQLAGGYGQEQADRLEKTVEQINLGAWVTYNPYEKDYFYYKNSGERIDKAQGAILVNKKVRVFG